MYGNGMGRAREGKIIKFLSLERLMAPHTHTSYSWPSSAQQNNVQRWKRRHAALCDLSGATPADPQPEIRGKGPLPGWQPQTVNQVTTSFLGPAQQVSMTKPSQEKAAESQIWGLKSAVDCGQQLDRILFPVHSSTP